MGDVRRHGRLRVTAELLGGAVTRQPERHDRRPGDDEVRARELSCSRLVGVQHRRVGTDALGDRSGDFAVLPQWDS